jgi:hypothetical protein
MEVWAFVGIVFLALVYLMWRSRRGSAGSGYVPGTEHLDARMRADEANLRAAQFPGPGGPLEGGGGTNAGGS